MDKRTDCCRSVSYDLAKRRSIDDSTDAYISFDFALEPFLL